MLDTALIKQLKSLKKQRKIVCLTACSAPMTYALDLHYNLLLIGGSVFMVLYVVDTTQCAGLDIMIRYGQAVMRRRQTAVVIIDLLVVSNQNCPEQALATIRRVIDETGADGIKLGGGSEIAGQVAWLIGSDIVVLARIGLLTQKAKSKSGFRIIGRTTQKAEQLNSGANALCHADAFGIVMKCINEPAAASIAANCQVPTIGISASPACDSQILVIEDILELDGGFTLNFVEKFVDLQTNIGVAAASFHETIVSETFPLEQRLFMPKQQQVTTNDGFYYPR